jgi:hypothetical protein
VVMPPELLVALSREFGSLGILKVNVKQVGFLAIHQRGRCGLRRAALSLLALASSHGVWCLLLLAAATKEEKRNHKKQKSKNGANARQHAA